MMNTLETKGLAVIVVAVIAAWFAICVVFVFVQYDRVPEPVENKLPVQMKTCCVSDLPPPPTETPLPRPPVRVDDPDVDIDQWGWE